MAQTELTHYSASTYSGVDITVVATLNFATMMRPFTGATVTANSEGLSDDDLRNYDYEDLNSLTKSEYQKMKGIVYELGTVQTISCQTHRPKAPVRSLGRSYVKGYTRGPRTIAGSMVFTVLNKHSLRDLCKHMEKLVMDQNEPPGRASSMVADQLLPIDLTFLFANEYGSVSRMALYGVEFLNSGHTMSIEDLLLEEVVQFVARDIDPMTDIKEVEYRFVGIRNSLFDAEEGWVAKDKQLSAVDLFKSKWSSYSKWLDRVHLRRRF